MFVSHAAAASMLNAATCACVVQVRWALSCIHLGMEAEWPEALLGCEMGEEVELPALTGVPYGQ